MDRRTKAKVFITVFSLVFSLFALFTFLFAAELSVAWRVVLLVIAAFWLITCVSNLIGILGKKR